MTIPAFIEKAVEGGWGEEKFTRVQVVLDMVKVFHESSSEFSAYTLHEILLSPLAWNAVGKVEGWNERCMDCDGDVTRKETPEYPNLPNGVSWCPNRCSQKRFMQGWHHKMHLMITALADGKTLEEYIATL